MQRSVYVIRLACVCLGLIVGFTALGTHLYGLQISRHQELLEKARRKYTTTRTDTGQRGSIFDVHGNLLAGNLACRDILAEPRLFNLSRDEIVSILHRELGVDSELLSRRFALPRVEVPVKREVEMDTAARLAAHKIRGLRFVDTYRRYYPKGSLAAHLIGFLDADGRGVCGIESLHAHDLAPISDRAVFERDRKGHRLENANAEVSKPRNGYSVYLTIDEPVQTIVEEELQALVEKHKPRAAYVIVANPKTGAILAMAQYPQFDPNVRSPENMSDGQWQNRILTHGFEPGSTMKCISLAGALDFGTVSLADVYDCENGMWFFHGRSLRDSGHSYGKLRVWQILQKSSNIGTAKIAIDMGEQRLYQTFKRFGFGEPTGIGFPDEAPGIFRPLRKWDGLSISRFPIGQGILVTPLQIVQAYCALANDGVMMQLHVVDRVVEDTGMTRLFYPVEKRRAVRPEAARLTVAAMKTVTSSDGTAQKAAVPGYEVAGKTGTAQKFVNGTYENRKYVSSFAGFVPADNPAFVLLVAVDEPTENGYYGSAVAAPVFSRIAEKTLRYLQIAPVRPAPVRATPATAQIRNDDPPPQSYDRHEG